MTEKKKDIPEDANGYWGGFSPDRKGTYKNQHLTKKFDDGRARIYPARKQSVFNSLENYPVGSLRQSNINTMSSAERTNES